MKFVPKITLTQALNDPSLFGHVFKRRSFWTWKTIGKLIDGEPLTEPRELGLYRQCTGRTKLPRGPVRRLIAYVGRRGGKDRFFSAVTTWRSALFTDWRRHMSAGEPAVALLLGRDRRQAGILARYCRGLLRSPMLAREVVRSTDDVTEFRNGSVLEVSTNHAALIRGRSACAVMGSEIAHWDTNEQGASSDAEVVSAASASGAMIPDGGLLCLWSSVHTKSGYAYKRYRASFGNDDASELVWFAPSRVMNPELPEAVVEEAIAQDGPRGRAEFENVWRESVTDFCPVDVIEGATDWGVSERAPRPGVRYMAFCDAALGTGQDLFTLAIGHVENDEQRTLVVDAVRERKPRFVPAAVIAELANLLHTYGIRQVHGDRVGGAFAITEWARNGIGYPEWKHTTSEGYLRSLPMLSSGRARLVDNETLRGQLAGLERKVSQTGHEVVIYQSGRHDDVATSVCGLLTMLATNTPAVWTAAMVEQIRSFRPGSSASVLSLGGERAAAMRQRAFDTMIRRIP